MNKKEKLKKLRNELDNVNSDEDVRDLFTKAKLTFSRLYGEQSLEFKELQGIFEIYTLDAFNDSIGILGNGTGNINISIIMKFKEKMRKLFDTLIELEDEKKNGNI